jgi:hypothetical protein
MTVHFFAEVSVLSRALHPFIVHRHEVASDFKISNNYLYRYPSQIILRWPLFLSTSVTSILFEILKLNEKSIHIYLPLGVHVAVKSLSFCSVILLKFKYFSSDTVRENIDLSIIENHIYLDLIIVKN